MIHAIEKDRNDAHAHWRITSKHSYKQNCRLEKDKNIFVSPSTY